MRWLTNEDRPNIDEDEERYVGKFLERKDEWEDVVRHALREAIHRVEGMACIRRRHYPFMMWLMQRLVYPRMMQSPVNPVDTEIGEADEKGNLQVIVEGERSIRGRVVQLPIASNFREETGSGEDGEEGLGDHGLADLELDLVFEIFGMGERGVVEDEDVGKGGADEVEQ